MPPISRLHATARPSACWWDSLLTDQAAETALRCALMQHREPFEEKVQLYRNGEAVYARLSRLYLPECKRSEGTGDILEDMPRTLMAFDIKLHTAYRPFQLLEGERPLEGGVVAEFPSLGEA